MNTSGLLKDGNETLDSFYHGRIRVVQKKKGFRFSVDAPLLADFIRTGPADEILELGTGNGIIPLLLGIKLFRSLTAVEFQASLADLARRNVALNGLENRITVVQADFRSSDPGRMFDVVFSNPPYIKNRGGHLSQSEEKSIAKHEIKCDISDIMRKTRGSLKASGRAYFIYPEKRREDFVAAMEAHGLKLVRIRSVCPRQGAAANLFLSECGPAAGATTILAPLVLYRADGSYTREAEDIFAGRAGE